MKGNQIGWKGRATLFLTSQCVTLFGSSLVQMAIIWHVTLQTSSGVWVAVLTLCSFTPQMAVSLFAGVWADRVSKKAMIITGDAGIALCTLALTLYLSMGAASDHTLFAIAAVSALRSIGAGIQTPAINSIIPELVPADALMRYNGFNSTAQAVIQFAAPAAAGSILAFGSLSTILIVDVATAVVGIGILSALVIPRPNPTSTAQDFSTLSDLKTGIRYSFGKPAIRTVLIVYGIFIFLSVPSGFMSALFVERVFDGNYLYLSISEMVGFAGMVAGGIAIGAWGGPEKSRMVTFVAGIGFYSAFAIGLGLAPQFWMYAIVMFLLSLSIPIVQSSATTILQQSSDPKLIGRVFGLFGMMFSGLMPLGMVMFGPLADVVSMRWLLIGSGVTLSGVILVLLVITYTKRLFIYLYNLIGKCG